MHPRHATNLPSDWYAWPDDKPTAYIDRRVRCLDCDQHIRNAQNPEAGRGICKLGLIGQHPAALHFCRDFVPAATRRDGTNEANP